VVVVIAAGAAALAAAIGNDYYLRIGFMICVYYLCAAGVNVLVGYAGQKSLGQAGLFAAGAYGAALLSTSFDFNAWLALVAAAIIAGLCGVLIAWPSLWVRGPYLAMVTLAVPEAARTAALEIKSRFPALQVSIYDTVTGSRTIVGLLIPDLRLPVFQGDSQSNFL
jgi:ABC-type branched-subunit amino acid transport system permease subunit